MRYLVLPFFMAACLVSGVVGAEPTETDRSLAQSLFEQGKQLMDAGNYADACPKLEESQRLDPSGGTLLNLALCHENQGKLATAWTEFKEALSAAKRDGREERVTAATEHIQALEPKLPWLTVTVSGAIDGEVIKLDGAAIGKAAWGSPVAIDPGAHELGASAPGRKPWTFRVTIAAGEKQYLAVPQLEVDPTQAAPAPVLSPAQPAPTEPPSQDKAGKGSGSTVGWILVGAGVVSLGVGTYFGIHTFSKKSESDELCPTDTTCTDEGVELNQDAHMSAWISNVGIGLGLVGVGVGTYLVLSGGGSGESKRASRSPVVALGARAVPGGGQVNLSGNW